MRSGDTGQPIPYFDSPIDHNIDVQSVFPRAPKLARKCENEHWYASGADGRSVAWAYGHVITNFLGWVDYHIFLAIKHVRGASL